MHTLKVALVTVMMLCLPPCLRAQSPQSAAANEIKAVMQKSEEDWNRGDLDVYVTCYKNSPDILLIGATIERGYESMLQTYRTYYGTKEKMGVLSYSELEVQPLDAKFATATGHFHLERTAGGGGSADGFYLLVFEKTPQGWKIIRDDSTVIRPTSASMCPTCNAETLLKTVSTSELLSVNGLPLNEAVSAREAFKKPLKAAYARQTEQPEKDCQADSAQQPYNVCMGKANMAADSDFAIFFNNLQMLCHDQEQLLTLQESERQWKAYSDSAMKATHAAWSDGTGAPGFAGEIYLSLVRDYMRQLHEIYGLNIAQ